MNERIKELAEQATEEVIRNTPSFLVTNEMWKEKFAKLIIEECSEYLRTNGSAFLVQGLKERFGIEE